ncbi:hypothetical protein SDC9_114656 [bioreactor metagenome]|uniref:Uncharacterized protein n=1 Tax=bioreactor metagenome TaxID=1076179 RepID=A0A645BRB0_9ZZZZ
MQPADEFFRIVTQDFFDNLADKGVEALSVDFPRNRPALRRQLFEAVFALPQFLPPPVFLGHIAENQYRAADRAGGVPDGRATIGDLPLCTVLGDECGVVGKIDIHSLGNGAEDRIFDRLASPGVDDAEYLYDRLAGRLGAGPAGKRFRRRVETFDCARRIAGDHTVTDRVEGRREMFFTFAQLFLLCSDARIGAAQHHEA